MTDEIFIPVAYLTNMSTAQNKDYLTFLNFKDLKLAVSGRESIPQSQGFCTSGCPVLTRGGQNRSCPFDFQVVFISIYKSTAK